MTKHKRSFLRWLVPLLCYYAVLAIFLTAYWKQAYNRAVDAKENEIAFDVELAMDDIDFSVEEATARIAQISEAFSLYTLSYNKNQITLLLKNMVEETDLSYSIICDLDGAGYDMDGRDVNISKESYFDDVAAEYSRGGLGMLLPDGQTDLDQEILIVSGLTFGNKEKGYLISKIPVVIVSEQLFQDKYIANRSDIVTIDGDILTFGHNKKHSATAGVTRQKLWTNLPSGISKDTIKLSISQKNVYISDIPDYGYVIVVPFAKMTGAVVTFITEDEMKQMIDPDLDEVRYLYTWLFLSSIFLVFLVFFANVVSNYIEKKKREKRFTAVERDIVTGLMTRLSATRAIESYIAEPGEKRGLLFIIGLNSSDKDKKETAFTNERIKEFSRVLEMNFRATDILGRISDTEFMVFLKDIHEDKDVRKQTDHMQMFLHDVRVTDGEMEISANAGAALYPDNGKGAHDIIAAAQNALANSRKDGDGRLSF
ncbi:diguanylate cyclase [Butyrivibrio sp. CB08]|uniref:GGDEF domain-containing protein n=1 Tax=Butyrivibrio sp. CB08 TaxID=2364879 RepID=UPI000EA8AB3E|nr:diguanylate cyclase [Butyrivibrio sp. CB08]RKM58732.1 diguanylate cyclase [Butyrivibrio sp. CB08]